MHSIAVAQDNVNLFVSRQMFSDFCMRILPWIPDSQSKLLAHCMQEEVKITLLSAILQIHLCYKQNYLSFGFILDATEGGTF